jgi:hypothetical protein
MEVPEGVTLDLNFTPSASAAEPWLRFRVPGLSSLCVAANNGFWSMRLMVNDGINVSEPVFFCRNQMCSSCTSCASQCP